MAEDDIDPCVICKERADHIPTEGYGVKQRCPRCGTFEFGGSALVELKKFREPTRRALLSGWVREQNDEGAPPLITQDVLARVLAMSLPTVAERGMGLLRAGALGLKNLGQPFSIRDPRLIAASYSVDFNDVRYLQKMLEADDLLQSEGTVESMKILPKGYSRLEAARRDTRSSRQGFIAMWFDAEMDDAHSGGFNQGIAAAGYRPLRVDRHEHVNRIDDEIIRQINASRFVVADFTGHRSGVYFEAGYAMGQGIPVFWTCRKDAMKKLHFDIRQFNCIGWETPVGLAERLAARIEAVLGPGPDKSRG